MLDRIAKFDNNGMAEVELSGLTKKVDVILESIPVIMALNERKNKREGHAFTSQYQGRPKDPDDDFIGIMAVAQNITCEFAERADSQCWLDQNQKKDESLKCKECANYGMYKITTSNTVGDLPCFSCKQSKKLSDNFSPREKKNYE